jgi:predicted  nucleic acid-binding Zn-ribbon protein
MERPRASRRSTVVTVRCLDCGELYSKPLGGGTVRANPGCPECGYVGWVLAPELPTTAGEPSRYAGDRRRRRSA